VHALLRSRLKQENVGDAAAILAGDWGVAVATDWMANLPVDGGALKRALGCFAEMQLAAVVGQIRDLVATDEDAELTYRLKTASYTVNGPLLLGAILAGATPVQTKAITQFAVPVGVAFQLRDDIIGVFAPPERTGKPFASDIRAGKRTALVIECLKRVDSRDARFMRRVLGNPEASERDLVRFVRLLEDSGALGHIEARIRMLYRRGLAQLAKSPLRAGGKLLLESAAEALIRRDA
jgi:geranylgeranyl diphosphate synthase type I